VDSEDAEGVLRPPDAADHCRIADYGQPFVDTAVAGKLLQQTASQQVKPVTQITDKLTGREEDVLRLMARGLSNAEIAVQFYFSEGTVRNHVSAIFAKLTVLNPQAMGTLN
jgi:DNA-binding NarL/FixJ family response regulator